MAFRTESTFTSCIRIRKSIVNLVGGSILEDRCVIGPGDLARASIREDNF